jgi:hypothetical protein
MVAKTGQISVLSGLAVAVCLELIGWQVSRIYWLAGLLVIVFWLFVWLFLARRDWPYKIMVWLIPTINFLAWCGFLTIVNSQPLRQLFIAVAAICQWWYWHYGWPVWLDDCQPVSWWRLVNAINLVTIWLLAAVLYGWQSFLAWPIFWPWLLWLILSGLIIWSDYHASSLALKKHWPIVAANWLIGGQLFLVVYFLPSSHFVLAYLLLVAYYLASQVGRTSLLKINTVRRLRYQFLVLIVGLLLVLLTAKWL